MILHNIHLQTHSHFFIPHSSKPSPPKLSQLKLPPQSQTLHSKDSGLIFRQKLDYLSSLNINTQKALTLNPTLRTAPLTTLTSTEHSFASLGLSRPAIGRILDMYPQLLTSFPHAHIDFLLSTVKIPPHHLPKAISRCPRLLVTDVHSKLLPAFAFLRSVGIKVTSRTSLLLVSSVEDTLLRKVEFLMGLRLSYEEVCNMIVRCPGLLTFSVEENFRPKVEFLFGEMQGGIEELKRFPQYFCYSLEGKIKPRFRVLKACGVRMRLDEMLKVSDGEFHARVVELRLEFVE